MGRAIALPFFVTYFHSRYFVEMLKVTKQDSEYWYVTLTEKVTIANPYFLFSMKCRQTDAYKNFILTDVSTAKERYNKFLFDEGATDNTTLEVGEHEYRIYAQISSNNLNPSLADELVETGILKVLPLLNNELFYQVS
jgi:hypothetical protein